MVPKYTIKVVPQINGEGTDYLLLNCWKNQFTMEKVNYFCITPYKRTLGVGGKYLHLKGKSIKIIENGTREHLWN